jgi:hypothetical protein
MHHLVTLVNTCDRFYNFSLGYTIETEYTLELIYEELVAEVDVLLENPETAWPRLKPANQTTAKRPKPLQMNKEVYHDRLERTSNRAG